jgi:heme-degrading monooxygenase HmoA
MVSATRRLANLHEMHTVYGLNLCAVPSGAPSCESDEKLPLSCLILTRQEFQGRTSCHTALTHPCIRHRASIPVPSSQPTGVPHVRVSLALDGSRARPRGHFQQRARLVDDFPGFLYLQLLKPQAGTATHTFLTTWTDADAFRRYMRSSERAVAHSREPADIMGRSTVRHEAYEVLLDSRGATS